MSQRCAKPAGFSLIETMVVVSLLSILALLAMPSMTTWIRNSQVRAVADGLQNGLRLAQAEAVRRSRQTVFFITNETGPIPTPVASPGAASWSVYSVALRNRNDQGDSPSFIESGALGSAGRGVQIAAESMSVCFSSLGRPVANAAPGVTGGSCKGGASQFDMSAAGSDRPLRVTVGLGGQVRMCDPAKTLEPSTPDGCPP